MSRTPYYLHSSAQSVINNLISSEFGVVVTAAVIKGRAPQPAPAVWALPPATRRLGGGIPLRIMPLGASITYGIASSDGNGYRAYLRGNLTAAGAVVNMVGNQKSGKMVDNDNEGWSGYVISEVHAKAKVSLPKWKPNIVLINLGTNDASKNVDISAAGSRMLSLLQEVWADSPGATVVLSTLLVNSNANTSKNVDIINKQYVALVSQLRQQGEKILLADMHSAEGPHLDELADGTHPTDYGYSKMAVLWAKAIQEADKAGFISKPANVGIPDDGNAPQ